MGDAFLSAFLQVLFDRLATREMLEFATSLRIEADLKKLRLMVSKLNATLKDAEEKQQVKDMSVQLWIDDLRDLADDAEDALDEFATVILQCKLEAEKQSRSWSNLLQDLLRPSSPVGAIVFNAQVASKLKAIKWRLENFAKETTELGLREQVGEKSLGDWQRFETTAWVADHVYGRGEDAKSLIELLQKDVDDKLCVIALTGLGGIGKTTLAQIVYNDIRVDGHYDLKAWVYVSGDFDLVKIMKGILESLGESCECASLEPLQSILRCKLKEKKFLLVLDDLWNENYSDWDVLQLPFRACVKGSKIIVTTRNEKVAQVVSTGPMFRIQELSEDHCWSLFEQHAFSELNCKVRPNLESIGKEIAKKCKGLPLAAKALGGLLRSESGPDEWHHVLNSKVWNLPHQKCGILPGLSLSYYHLPSHLKPCFAYCAIFPKGYKFDDKELVRLWIAQGLVQKPQGNDINIEDVGSQYFHDLLSRSLFQRSNENISRFIMHDLINDLAQFAAGDRCLRLEGNIKQENNWGKARHLSYIRQKRDSSVKVDACISHTRLRTFLPLDGEFGNCQMTDTAIHRLLKTFSRLRVLSLKRNSITQLPDHIKEMKHLRYLDLSYTFIRWLPESVATLYNLQVLLLHGCHNLIQLPTGMQNLVNLRDLDIEGSDIKRFPPHIGRLRSLRTLSYFPVRTDGGSGITELKDLPNLQGDLSIFRLESIDKHTDAVNANLRDKKYLNKLVLDWSLNKLQEERNWNSMDMMDEDVLDGLQPHRNLKELSIKHYGGEKFSSWIADPSFSNLMSVSFINCKNCKFLPPLGQLPSLKDLVIEGMEAVRKIGCEFYGGVQCSIKPYKLLETLKFKNMPIWKEWCSFSNEDFPCLRELHLENCPELSKEIPKSLTSLKALEIRNCMKLSGIPCLPKVQDLVLAKCHQVMLESGVMDLISLKKLVLDKVVELKHLPSKLFLELTALCDLQISNCDELKKLFNVYGLTNNTSLKRLKVHNCSLISLWPEEEEGQPDLLECLEISNCKNLSCLPFQLHSLRNLDTLKIINCPFLVTLPAMDSPSNLRHLQIKNCLALKSLPHGLVCNNKLSLEVMEIDDCASLNCFPNGELPQTLQKLKITNCSNLSFLPAGLLSRNTCLKSLQIGGCSLSLIPDICSSLSECSCPSSSSSTSSSRLKVLEIHDCFLLKSLPDGLRNFIHLDALSISNCSRLVSFPNGGLPPNLTTLSISKCGQLKALPSGMNYIASLQDLTLRDCDAVVYPEGGLPFNLKSLRIIRCCKLISPCRLNLYKLTSLRYFEITNEPPRV